MRYAEKLLKAMLLQGLNQQKLARLASVSDSEISRILRGKSHPSLEYSQRLARALGLSLDYLADDALDEDPGQAPRATTSDEEEALAIVRELGPRTALRILDSARYLGPEIALRRLYGLDAKPVIEVGDGTRPAPAPAGEPPREIQARRTGSA